MKPLNLASLLVFLPFFALGQQSIAPSVNNLASLEGLFSNTFITASIGEPAITTIKSKESIITQGFLQPEILPCIDVNFRYYPNPAKDYITIEAFGCEAKIESMEIIDMWGRLVATAKPGDYNELFLGDLAQGVYVIRLLLTNQENHTISVVKTSN